MDGTTTWSERRVASLRVARRVHGRSNESDALLDYKISDEFRRGNRNSHDIGHFGSLRASTGR